MWELSLKCNLNCNFCYQQDRRIQQISQLNLEDTFKIIDNLGNDVHIAFIGGESFLFSNFIKILQYLDKKGITYEITSNGTLIDKFINDLNNLKRLSNINFSVDYFGEKHSIDRGYKYLFSKITKYIPLIKTKVNINTVIFPDSKLEDLLKIHIFFSKLGIKEHTFLMYSSFTKKELKNSINKINSLVIKTLPGKYTDFRKKVLKNFKIIFKINKQLKLNSKLNLIPKSLIINKNSCKHLENQYRINENGKISICHYIDNEFDDIKKTKFNIAIKNNKYLKFKKNITKQFPLDICKNCCKLL